MAFQDARVSIQNYGQTKQLGVLKSAGMGNDVFTRPIGKHMRTVRVRRQCLDDFEQSTIVSRKNEHIDEKLVP